jgi:hypothetical protein
MQDDGYILDVQEHYRVVADGRRFRSDFRLRFTPRAELEQAIAAAGLVVRECFGDWERTPFAGAAREIIPVGGLPAL